MVGMHSFIHAIQLITITTNSIHSQAEKLSQVNIRLRQSANSPFCYLTLVLLKPNLRGVFCFEKNHASDYQKVNDYSNKVVHCKIQPCPMGIVQVAFLKLPPGMSAPSIGRLQDVEKFLIARSYTRVRAVSRRESSLALSNCRERRKFSPDGLGQAWSKGWFRTSAGTVVLLDFSCRRLLRGSVWNAHVPP